MERSTFTPVLCRYVSVLSLNSDGKVSEESSVDRE